MGVLSDAFHEIGLTSTDAAVGAGVAVEPVAGGPLWGWDGRTGLVVVLYLDDGWTLMVNQAGMRRPVSIYAPVTDEGARDVAELVGQVLRGEIKDPFRDGR